MRKAAKTTKSKPPSAGSRGAKALKIVDEASDTEGSARSVTLEMLMPGDDCKEYLSKAVPDDWDEVMRKMSATKLSSLHMVSLLQSNALGSMLNEKYMSEVVHCQSENDALSVKCEDQQTQMQVLEAEVVKLKRELKELEPVRVASWEITALKTELSRIKESEADLSAQLKKENKCNEELVVKVIPHVAMTFLKSDEVGQLMDKVVGAANAMGRWKAMEKAPATGKPVVLEDLAGYTVHSEAEYSLRPKITL